MKNVIFSLIIIIVAMMISFVGCKKDSQTSVDYTTIDTEQSNAKSALVLSQSYNDTLGMVYDTAKTHKNNALCIKYDKLYHKNDSMFSMHPGRTGPDSEDLQRT